MDFRYELVGITVMNVDSQTGKMEGVKVAVEANRLIEYCQKASLDEVLIKLESSGSAFFARKRVGRNGRIFKMYSLMNSHNTASIIRSA